MKILAIDTSTSILTVAVIDTEQKQLLGEVTLRGDRSHSQKLLPVVTQCLEELGIGMDEPMVMAVSSGPGSYTGIRIGVTAAKTLSWAQGWPLYSESTLTVLAMNGRHFDGVVVPLLNARRQRVYTGAYAFSGEEIKEVFPQQVIYVEKWLTQLVKLNSPILFLGDDTSLFNSEIIDALGDNAHFGQAAENTPHAAALGQLVAHKWEKGLAPESMNFTPEYLQLTQAQVQAMEKKDLHGSVSDDM